MSYIRSTSNPEAMYIWADDKNQCNIWHHVKPPLSSGGGKVDGSRSYGFVVSDKALVHLCKSWRSHGRDDIAHMGIRAQVVYVYTKTGKKVPKQSTRQSLTDKKKREFLVRLSYKKHFVCMWLVTWDHIVASAVGR